MSGHRRRLSGDPALDHRKDQGRDGEQEEHEHQIAGDPGPDRQSAALLGLLRNGSRDCIHRLGRQGCSILD